MTNRSTWMRVALWVALAAVIGTGAVEAKDGPRDIGPVTLVSGLEATPASAVLPAGAAVGGRDNGGKTATTVLSDGFEGTFPGTTWRVWHPSSGAAQVDWGRSTYRKASGAASIWCAGAGSQSPGAGGMVPVNTQSWAIAGPFDLSGTSSGTLVFDLWLATESGYDFFKWLASFDGSNFSGLQTSTSTSGFSRVEQDLTDWGSAGNVTGRSQVWIAFIYQSDESQTHEGAYVDNVNLSTGGGGGSSCGTYVLTADNENNAGTGSPDGDWGYCLYNTDSKHPIEFRFDINEVAATSAQLLLLCNDVDRSTNPSNPEIDKVYMNDTYLGTLTGADQEDSTTLFTVPVNALNIGRNWVTIEVNQNPGSDPDDWCVELKQAQLVIDGGCEGSASCRSVTTNQSSYAPGATVAVTYEIDTSRASQQVRVESNLVSPDGIIVAGTDRVFTIAGTANEPQTVQLTLPASAVAGTYKAQVLVFDAASGGLESSCERAFTVTGGGGSCSLTCSATVPTTVQAGVPVTLEGSATASGCTSPIEYFWFPDANTTATAFERVTTVTYPTPGTYTWTFVAVSGNARCERTGTITVTSGGGGCTLNCSATVPATAQVGVPVTLQGSATATGCTSAVEYFWFPDSGNTATIFNRTGSWTYTAPGTYTWTFVVISGNARCERTGTITITSGGGGGSCDYQYWVPVASRANGLNNSLWRTDLGILNRGTGTANVEVRLSRSSGDLIRTTSLPPGRQLIRADILGWLSSSFSGSGPLRICSNQPLEVTSRTYNLIAAGVVCFPRGTMGQALDGALGAGMISAGQTAWLPHLIENAGFRTNIGFTNTGTAAARLTVSLHAMSGALLTSYQVNLAPGEWKQDSQPFRNRAGQTALDAASASVRVDAGSGVVVYGSVVDNVTGDPTTIRMRN